MRDPPASIRFIVTNKVVATVCKLLVVRLVCLYAASGYPLMQSKMQSVDQEDQFLHPVKWCGSARAVGVNYCQRLGCLKNFLLACRYFLTLWASFLHADGMSLWETMTQLPVSQWAVGGRQIICPGGITSPMGNYTESAVLSDCSAQYGVRPSSSKLVQ